MPAHISASRQGRRKSIWGEEEVETHERHSRVFVDPYKIGWKEGNEWLRKERLTRWICVFLEASCTHRHCASHGRMEGGGCVQEPGGWHEGGAEGKKLAEHRRRQETQGQQTKVYVRG